MPEENVQYQVFEENKENPKHECQCHNAKAPTIEGLITGLVSQEVAAQFKTALEQAGKYADEVYSKAFDLFKKEVVTLEVGKAVAEAKNAANTESIKEIERKFHLNNLIETVEKIPREMTTIRTHIAEKRQTMRTVRQSLADAELAMKEAEASLLADIMAETNPATNKPMFSNDKARQAELMARKKIDGDYHYAMSNYNSVKEQADALEDDVYALDIRLKEAEMEFQGVCKVLGAITAEMNIYAQVCGFNVTYLAPSVGFSVGNAQSNDTDVENEKGAW